MELYWKTATAALLAVVLILMLRRQEMGLLLGLAVCAMTALAAVEYLQPVMELLAALEEVGKLDGELVTVLLKAVGIGLLTEIAGMVCSDSGNGALAKALQLLGTAVILWLSVPLFTALLDLLREMVSQ